MRPLKIVGVFIFLKKRKTHTLVGKLHKAGQKFIFTYEGSYLNGSHSIALGPEFPLTQKEYSSNKLFPSFEDRIPSIHNPAYPEYLSKMFQDRFCEHRTAISRHKDQMYMHQKNTCSPSS